MLAIRKHMTMILHVKQDNQCFRLDLLTWAAPNAVFVMTFGNCNSNMQFLEFHEIHKHMARFLQPKFKIHGLEKSQWGHELWPLTSADWPMAKCPWPMTTDTWATNPEPWALGPGNGPWALGPDQDDPIMSKSHKLMDNTWLSADVKVIKNIWACFCNPNPGLHHLNPEPGIDPWALVMVHESWSLPQIMQLYKNRMNWCSNHEFSQEKTLNQCRTAWQHIKNIDFPCGIFTQNRKITKNSTWNLYFSMKNMQNQTKN